jgi:hypothetical protein
MSDHSYFHMKALIFLFLMCGMLRCASAAEKPSALDLIGKWEAAIEFGKFKFRLILRVAKTAEGRLAVTMDSPEQGQKGAPVNALLFNHPEVRFEIDQFGTAYNGKLSADQNEISGAFEEGPGGRPISVVFKRSTEPDVPEPEKVFTFAKGEPQDIRGYWKGSLEAGPGMTLAVGLNIGRVADGSFLATLDLLDQGAKGIPASVTSSNKTARLQLQAFQAVFEGKLSEDGKSLAGDWVQRGRTNVVAFARLDEPASILPKNLSFEPDKASPEDVRGFWKGVLETPGGRLRLALKIGRAPDGTYAGTMASLDQGGREIPMSKASFQAPKLMLEWKGIRGKFDGTINKDGTVLDGKWEQFGNPAPLKLERTASFEGESKL